MSVGPGAFFAPGPTGLGGLDADQVECPAVDYLAVAVAGNAVRSYRTFSPLPCFAPLGASPGGSFSVALSLGSPPPDVIRHRMSMEPGLSSPTAFRRLRERPSGRLTR